MTYNEFIKILEENTAEHLCVYMHCNTKNGTISISPADILELLNEKRIENQKQKPKTNYDRIKSMSVEEMAEYLSDHWSCIGCEFEKVCDDNLYRYISCHKNIKQWLLQEVSKDEETNG